MLARSCRVDVRDGGDERGPEERPRPTEASPAAGERLLGGLEDTCFARKDVVQGMDERGTVVRRGWGRGVTCRRGQAPREA